MTGKQKRLANELREVLTSIEGGKYGTDDDIDIESVDMDFAEIIQDMLDEEDEEDDEDDEYDA